MTGRVRSRQVRSGHVRSLVRRWRRSGRYELGHYGDREASECRQAVFLRGQIMIELHETSGQVCTVMGQAIINWVGRFRCKIKCCDIRLIVITLFAIVDCTICAHFDYILYYTSSSIFSIRSLMILNVPTSFVLKAISSVLFQLHLS